MDLLEIEATLKTPYVLFNPFLHELTFSGKCHPENAKIFFSPLLGWLKSYEDYLQTKKVDKVTIKLFFSYLNSSSLKHFALFFQPFNTICQKGIAVDIIWYYDEDDEDMRETGLELFEFIGSVANLKLVEYKGGEII